MKTEINPSLTVQKEGDWVYADIIIQESTSPRMAVMAFINAAAKLCPILKGWDDYMVDCIRHGKMIEHDDAMFWGIERTDDNCWYICLNLNERIFGGNTC